MSEGMAAAPAAGRRPTSRLAFVGTLALVAASVLLGACSGSAGGGAGTPTVTDAWVRVPMTPTGPAGAFMTIANPGSEIDALVGASSPVAEAVEVHQTTMSADGSMGMSPIDRLEIPAGGRVALTSGSYHIMLIGLKQALKAGDTVELTLTFEKAGTVIVEAEVRAG